MGDSNEQGCCAQPDLYAAASLASVQVVLYAGGSHVFAAGESVCLTCGIITSERAENQSVADGDRLRLIGRRAIGKRGTADSLRLPDWGHVLLEDHIEKSISHRLLSPAYNMMTREDAITRIMMANGSNANALRIPIVSPLGIPSMIITRDVVTHLVKNGKDHHVRYAPLISTILEDPLEVWCRDIDDKKDQIHYLRKFNQGAQEITVMTVGDQRDEFLRTHYLLSGRKQAQNKREGRLLYAKWSLQ